MKLRLSILLLAAALAAAPAAGQTIKSLGYNTTNGQVVYSGTNPLTFTNSLQFATNARAATRTNLGGTTVGNAVFTATNAAAAATAIGLGTANEVTFGRVAAGNTSLSTNGFSGGDFAVTAGYALTFVSGGVASTTRTNLGLPGTWLTNTDVTNFRTAIGLGATNNVTFSNITATGSLAVSNAATFSTNVTVNGNISVGSLTTTTPSTWALDATQTAAATNGILALPSNANVIRLTNNNAISGVSGGVLGAFYYLVNQTTNAVTISNVGGITVQGGTSLTLGANQAATLVATGATNASVAARGDLNDVALGGTANTAPSQTASSGSSLMTRDLGDVRYLPSFGEYMDGTFYRQTMADWMPTRVTNGGSATFNATGSRWELASATNVGNLVGVRMGRMEGVNNTGSSGGNNMFSSGFSAFVFVAAWSRSNQVLRFVVGHSTGDPIGQYPTNRAVGIEFSGDSDLSARLIAHNGTTATNGPLISGLKGTPYAAYSMYAVRYYPNGTVELYRSLDRGAFTNIAAATISGGPTNNASGFTAGAVDLAYDSGTNATPSGATTRVLFWGYQYHD